MYFSKYISDFCYTGDVEHISVQECVAVCAMVAAYDSGTKRLEATFI